MSLSIVQKFVDNGQVMGLEVAVAAGSKIRIDGDDGQGEEIAGSTTDKAIAVQIDASALKALLMYCTGANLTVETNNGTTPDHSFALVAGKPGICWESNSPQANPLGSTDVTALYVTNAGATAAKFFLFAAVDPTP